MSATQACDKKIQTWHAYKKHLQEKNPLKPRASESNQNMAVVLVQLCHVTRGSRPKDPKGTSTAFVLWHSMSEVPPYARARDKKIQTRRCRIRITLNDATRGMDQAGHWQVQCAEPIKPMLFDGVKSHADSSHVPYAENPPGSIPVLYNETYYFNNAKSHAVQS